MVVFHPKKHCSGQFVEKIFLNVPFFVDNFVETGFAHSLIDSVTRQTEFGVYLVHCCTLSLCYLGAETGYRVATPYMAR